MTRAELPLENEPFHAFGRLMDASGKEPIVLIPLKEQDGRSSMNKKLSEKRRGKKKPEIRSDREADREWKQFLAMQVMRRSFETALPYRRIIE